MHQKLKAKNRILGAVLFAFLATGFMSQQVQAAGPVTIKWMRTCAGGDFSHSQWIMGLSDGSKVFAHFNPSQGRVSMCSMALSAYMAGKPVYYENASANTNVVCGVTATHSVDSAPGSAAVLMVGEP